MRRLTIWAVVNVGRILALAHFLWSFAEKPLALCHCLLVCRFPHRRRILASRCRCRVQAGEAIATRCPEGGLGAVPASWTMGAEEMASRDPYLAVVVGDDVLGGRVDPAQAGDLDIDAGLLADRAGRLRPRIRRGPRLRQAVPIGRCRSARSAAARPGGSGRLRDSDDNAVGTCSKVTSGRRLSR
jgi:hypothetical protein